MENPKKNSILIVDDERINLEFLNSVLSGEYKLYLTKSGNSAIKMAKELSPDLIMLDIIMPDVDGYDVLTELKSFEKTRNIPVIIISGLSNAEDEENGFALGAADFIHKPFNAKIIVSRVHSQMQIVNQFKELGGLYEDLETAVEEAKFANNAKSSFLARMTENTDDKLDNFLIDDVNIIDGIARFGGSRETYMNVLRSYAVNTRPLLDDIENYLLSANLADYAIAVHGIKGASLGVGAMKAGKDAARLEKLAKTGQTVQILTENGSFVGYMEGLLNSIDNAMTALNSKKEKRAAAAPDPTLL